MYRRKDHFHARAKASGYRSRAAYKLLEIADRFALIRPGDRVVDLGGWPGGWLQVASERVGRSGRVVGVDLAPIDPIAGGVVSLIRGDARDAVVQEEIRRRCGGAADVILSDMAPKLSGVRATDVARAAALADAALAIAVSLLAPGGRLLVKIFMAAEADAFIADVGRHFREVRTVRPDATRKQSAELYVVGLGYLRP